ncbi:hypothetical protein FOCG_09239 [Fusarium oxysporum f. sp. radicis-lycopersici 26381]|uniref:Uncharacterized protein n=1 Tax=Fusarium oxysporum Fo47 TaxID=660027 RepID=W9KE09_FUSOX|nr:hypothetical protein FOZG_08649 [Fusarium oxysporum Fo47]EXL51161.1 hypothetical protein FOCG_09239 [Fusarium oxysporum f. sp. radicis-lycopersici 26381]
MAVKHVGDMLPPMHSFCGPRRDKCHDVMGPTKDPSSLSNLLSPLPRLMETSRLGNVTGKEVGKSLLKDNEEHSQYRSCDVGEQNFNSHKSSQLHQPLSQYGQEVNHLH